MEPNPPFFAKKLCNLARLGFFTIRKGFSKSKLVLDDIHFLMKRGKIMGKALKDEIMVNDHIASLTCRPRDVHLSFVSPLEYEFSCRTSPSYQPYVPKRKYRSPYTRARAQDGVVLGAMRCRDSGDFHSPLIIPRDRRRRMQKLRDNSSRQYNSPPPFVLKDEYEDPDGVDDAAEEFIQSFYKQLRLQKWLAVLESADDYHV
ncbi:hypothetical protein CCACVL1_05043 [Corchorus capsularis]|uniref:Uncharacterized protein n=1 Tax=Corchorus capsularis TaxID=210143 RepID=A0A1R3JN49_COCAP|nr:hypothetical protein CCACVL1_05043 [Corchorus capsularis]